MNIIAQRWIYALKRDNYEVSVFPTNDPINEKPLRSKHVIIIVPMKDTKLTLSNIFNHFSMMHREWARMAQKAFVRATSKTRELARLVHV